VRTFFTVIKGARSAPGPAGRRSGVAPREDDADPDAAQLPPVTGRAFLGERCAPGRRLPLLGPPGHGGVGARAVPAARRTGRGAATVSAKRANCKNGPFSRRSSIKPGKITGKGALRHR
jgi:hypothetical protein